MLWYKGWLEMRFRVLSVLVVFLCFMVFIERTTNTHNPSRQSVEQLLNIWTFYFSIVPVMLGGAGIKTQPRLITTRGHHGSMYFTLSLPVSRFRLLATRAGLGMLETVGVAAILTGAAWFIFPALKAHLPSIVLFDFFVTVSVCASAFYFLSVLLAIFLDDVWQFWGSIIAIALLRWMGTAASFPPSINIFRAMGVSSPLFMHTLPWPSMGVALSSSVILFLAAWKALQTREY
jgi:hypothetical protein